MSIGQKTFFKFLLALFIPCSEPASGRSGQAPVPPKARRPHPVFNQNAVRSSLPPPRTRPAARKRRIPLRHSVLSDSVERLPVLRSRCADVRQRSGKDASDAAVHWSSLGQIVSRPARKRYIVFPKNRCRAHGLPQKTPRRANRCPRVGAFEGFVFTSGFEAKEGRRF